MDDEDKRRSDPPPLKLGREEGRANPCRLPEVLFLEEGEEEFGAAEDG